MLVVLFFYCVGQVLISELSFSPAADTETSGVIHRGTPRLRICYNYEHWSLCMVLVVPHHCFVTGDRPTMCN